MATITQSIFTDQEPVGHNFNDAQAIINGTKFKSDVDGFVTHIRFRAPDTVTGGVFGGFLWEVVSQDFGHLLSETAGVAGETLVPTGWNTIICPDPVPIVANVVYQSVIYNAAGYYVASPHLLRDAPIVNGHLTAVQDGLSGIANGSYDYYTGGDAFPKSFFEGACYFQDVVFTTEEGPSATDTSKFFMFMGF